MSMGIDDAKEIPGFAGYLVTKDGRVFGRRTNKGMRKYFCEMRPSTDAKGYSGITLCGDGGLRRKVRVHRLVAEVFIRNPESKPCVRHLDGSKNNNAVENLAWGTYAENEADKHAHGTYGTRRNGKLTEKDRAEVFSLAEQGKPQKEIAASLNVSRPTITRVLNGSTWA